jgi:hypothetical protein
MEKTMTQDPRIDPLGTSAILTDTQFRIAFAPIDQMVKATGLMFKARKAKLDDMQSQMRVGDVHVQIKAGFAPERHVVLTGPETMLLMDAFDKFITELPDASRAKPIEEN